MDDINLSPLKTDYHGLSFKLASDKPVNISEKAYQRAKRILAEVECSGNKTPSTSSTTLSSTTNNQINNESSSRSIKRASPASPTSDGYSTPVIKYRRSSCTPFRPPTIHAVKNIETRTSNNNIDIESCSKLSPIKKLSGIKDTTETNSTTPTISRISSVLPKYMITPPETPDQKKHREQQNLLERSSMSTATSFSSSSRTEVGEPKAEEEEENFEFDDDFDEELVRQIDVSLQESSFVL